MQQFNLWFLSMKISAESVCLSKHVKTRARKFCIQWPQKDLFCGFLPLSCFRASFTDSTLSHNFIHGFTVQNMDAQALRHNFLCPFWDESEAILTDRGFSCEFHWSYKLLHFAQGCTWGLQVDESPVQWPARLQLTPNLWELLLNLMIIEYNWIYNDQPTGAAVFETEDSHPWVVGDNSKNHGLIEDTRRTSSVSNQEPAKHKKNWQHTSMFLVPYSFWIFGFSI